MLLVIGIAALVVGIILAKKKDIIWNPILCVGGGVLTVALLTVLIVNSITFNAQFATEQETYKALLYKSENINLRDEFGWLNKEWIDEVQEWNEDVVAHQELDHNFWVGVVTPNFWDELETIDIESVIYTTE